MFFQCEHPSTLSQRGPATADGHHSSDGAALQFGCDHSFCVRWGGPAIQPYGTDNSLAGLLPLDSPPLLHPPIKFPTLIAFPGSQSEKRRKNLEGGGKRKNSIVGSLYSSLAYALQTTNCEPQSRKKEAQRSKAVEDWPTSLQFSGPWLL